jgi:tyrosinase
VTLAGEEVTVTLELTEPQSPGVQALAEDQRRAFLNVEGIVGDRNPGISYAVYLNVNEQQDPADAVSRRVGNLSFFGIERARDTSTDHPAGHGLTHAFNVTDLVTELRNSGDWDPAKLTVKFSPLRPVPPPSQPALIEAQRAIPSVRIGRVSLYYQ